MSELEFTFVGYLVQEPYVSGWWKREGKRLASLENTVHPSFEKPRWETIGGIMNETEFLLAPPEMSGFPGWVLCGYCIERTAIPRLRVEMLDPQRGRVLGPLRYEYALHLTRFNDGLERLGYEVMDAVIHRLSILNNCGYTMEQIERNAGPLNQFSLLETVRDAKRFQEYIKSDTEDHRADDCHADGVIFEVWGQPDC